MQSVGMELLASVAKSGNLHEFLNLGLSEDLFKPSEKEVFEYIVSHIKQHAVIPAIETIVQDCGITLPGTVEPPSYYKGQVLNRFTTKTLSDAMVHANTELKALNPENALNTLREAVMAMVYCKNKGQIVDFRQAAPIINADYKAKQKSPEDHGILTGWPYLDAMMGGATGGDVLSYVGRPAMGKAQPLDAQVLTPLGFKAMGALQIGDTLASVDGASSVVTEIHPQGVKQTFEITFRDRRTTEACAEHLWEVFYREWAEPRILSTEILIGMLEKERYKNRLSVRLFSGHFGERLSTRLHPYLMGVLLGDGGFTGTGPMVSSADEDLLQKVEALLPPMYVLNHRGEYDYAIVQLAQGTRPNQVKEALKSYNLWGCRSEDKWIPEDFFRLDREGRATILQGLMDTDGWVEKTGAVCFASTSHKLALGVQRLVRSLGGMATIRRKENNHQGCWVVGVMMQSPKEIFSLPRKQERTRASATHAGTPTTLRSTILSIVPKRKAECQCITVSHASRLYITDGYTVTHNTFKVLKSAHYAWWTQKKVPLVISMEMKPLLLMHRLTAMHTHKNLTQLKSATYSTKTYNGIMTDLHSLEGFEVPFWIVDGNLTATIDDIWMLCRQLKPESVYIDGAYLIKHAQQNIKKNERISKTAEGIKAMAGDLNLPFTSSYQLNREVEKLKKGEEAGLEHIAGADDIGQLSSVVLGMLEAESVETIQRRRVSIMKGRNGEVGEFFINWDFNTMNFDQWEESQGSDLTFL